MLNIVWFIMLISAFFCAVLTGRTEALGNAIINGAQDAASLSFSLLGIMCLWTGLSAVAEKSGLTAIIAKALYPLLHIIFPKLKKGSAAMSAIVMNVVANLLGMGNAATPLGLCAMEELNKINHDKSRASDEMCMFAVLNTASIQIIPSTLIALRTAHSSKNPGEIILPVWISSIIALSAALFFARFFASLSHRRK